MSAAALDTLIAAERALIAALDGNDPRAIERATTDYAAAVSVVRSCGAWRSLPDVKDRVNEAMALADAARTRVNVLADLTRRRLSRLTRAAGRDMGIGYTRNGRLRA